jgi:CSLREA domain-containing protein
MKKLIYILIPVFASYLLISVFYYSIGTSRASALTSSPASLGAILVNTLEDELNNDGDCSLREALESANTNSEVDTCSSGDVLTDTITFDIAGTIVVNSQLEVTAGGPLVINGGEVITISGGGTTRVWWVEEESDITFEQLDILDGESALGGGLYNNLGNVTIVNDKFTNNHSNQCGGMFNLGTVKIIDSEFLGNNADGWSGAICNNGTMSISNSDFIANTTLHSTGAISNNGSLTVDNCSFLDNAGEAVGGISSFGKLAVTHSTFSGNSGSYGGGMSAAGETTIIDSTFSGNIAGWGAGIASGYYGYGDTTIINTTITGNSADSGSGVYNNGNTTIINSTISGNVASVRGGGIFTSAASGLDTKPFTLNIVYSTISDNSAPEGGGIFNYAQTVLLSSIIANSITGSDCQINLGSITDAGHNLDTDGTCGLIPANGSLPNSVPLLGLLQDNGGATFTQALLPGSPAIDAGDNAHCPQFDQRGMYRPIDGDAIIGASCDIGSYEAGGSLLTVDTLEDELNSDGDCSLPEAIQAANTNSSVDMCGSGNSLFDMIIFVVFGDVDLDDPLLVTNSGELMINGDDYIHIDGGGTTNVLAIEPGAALRLFNLAIENGNSSGNGAGINNQGDLVISHSLLFGNFGVYGGGIYNSGSLAIYNSTFFENSAQSGGGIQNWGTLAITNSTFYANTAIDAAGGIDNWGELELINSTISQNSAAGGAGIYAGQPGSVMIINTIVADNQGGDCYGTITDGGHNLDSDGTCNLIPAQGSLPTTDPLLGLLQDNGGAILTQALLTDSPAIDAGDNDHCPAIDQRSYPRPMDGDEDGIPVCDIGAYENSLGHLLVNTLTDTVEPDGYCSLREALNAANTNTLVEDCGQGDTLTDTIYFSVQGTITITNQLTVQSGGPLVVDGGNEIKISADGSGRVWWVEPGGELTLQQLVVADAFVYEKSGGGLYNDSGTVTLLDCKFLSNTAEIGGGIYNDSGSVILRDCVFMSNTTEWGGGGAIENQGTLDISNCSFTENIASGGWGGAIENWGTITVTNSTFSNGYGYWCGGICNMGNGVISNSTFSENISGGSGGGLCNDGSLTFINNTVSNNSTSVEAGGGIFNTGTMTMTNSTIASNSAPSGGGVNSGSGITMVNTIIAGNTGGDCAGAITDAGHNLDSDGTCVLNPALGSLPNTDPLLGPLRDNGGSTLTRALLESSPAIDAGDNSQCPLTDQRGFPRPFDGDQDELAVCDIGAYEYQGPPLQIFLPLILKFY